MTDGGVAFLKPYSGRNFIASPQSKMASPADACEYLPSFSVDNFESPMCDSSTIVIIVAIVTSPNAEVTITTPHPLFLAAGYITRGIKGSQGPNTNIVNRIHGVMSCALVTWA